MRPLAKWLQIWFELKDRIMKLPKNKQAILLEDMKTALENRLKTMETSKEDVLEIE